jgi:hypothetical protein
METTRDAQLLPMESGSVWSRENDARRDCPTRNCLTRDCSVACLRPCPSVHIPQAITLLLLHAAMEDTVMQEGSQALFANLKFTIIPNDLSEDRLRQVMRRVRAAKRTFLTGYIADT